MPRRPSTLLLLSTATALVPPSTPQRCFKLQASLESFLADRSAAKLFYDGVTDGALKSYAGEPLGDNSLDDQKKISALVDYMHTELMKKSMMADYTDEAAPLGDEFDDFIEEGRKMLAISHSRVCGGSDEVAVSETVWPALAELFKDENRAETDRKSEIRAGREAEIAAVEEAEVAQAAEDARVEEMAQPTRRKLISGGLAEDAPRDAADDAE